MQAFFLIFSLVEECILKIFKGLPPFQGVVYMRVPPFSSLLLYNFILLGHRGWLRGISQWVSILRVVFGGKGYSCDPERSPLSN